MKSKVAQIAPKTNTTQRGVALVMSLVFLMLLTILGVTSMSTSSLEEKMANNTRDRNLAFQAAESALLLGETWISSKAADPTPWLSSDGLYTPVAPVTSSTPANWDAPGIWSSTSIVAYPCNPDDASQSDPNTCLGGGRTKITKIATQPKYIVENMGPVDSATPNTIAYRITARGTGGSDAAKVMLQSTFVKTY